jgi:hypothetical protein
MSRDAVVTTALHEWDLKKRIELNETMQAGTPALLRSLTMTEWKNRRRLAKKEDHFVGQQQWYSRGYIPHFDQEGLTQTLTFRLFDSMPQSVLDV